MIRENIVRIRQGISAARSKAGSDSYAITVVAVTKERKLEQIRQAVAAGINDIGENRVQEALLKYNALGAKSQEPTAIKWHLVGHLQSNKAKEAVRIFDLIHSLDSLRLAYKINEEAKKINKIQDILVQVNTSGEVSKYGLRPDETIEIVEKIANLSNINIRGLMTIAPLVNEPEKARPYFRMLKELRDKINSLHITRYTLHILSMGMTDDFAVAIEEGANMVRIGRGIFENADRK